MDEETTESVLGSSENTTVVTKPKKKVGSAKKADKAAASAKADKSAASAKKADKSETSTKKANNAVSAKKVDKAAVSTKKAGKEAEPPKEKKKTTLDLVYEAIEVVGENRKGASVQAIKKYVIRRPKTTAHERRTHAWEESKGEKTEWHSKQLKKARCIAKKLITKFKALKKILQNMHKLTLRSYFKPHKIDTCLCHFSFSAKNNKQYGHNRVVLKLLGIKGIHNYVLVLFPASRSSSSLLASQPKKLYFNDFLVKNLHTTCSFHDNKNNNKSAEKSEAKVDQPTSAKSGPSAKEGRRRKIDYTKTFTERNFITPLRAMNEYLLKPSDLESLRKIQRRSPFEDNPPINVYLRRDVEQKSIEVWGSQEALQREIKKRQEEDQIYRDSLFNVKRILREYSHATMHQEELKRQEMILRTSGRVVMTAVIINATNFALKLVAWIYTGSHSMFAEAIHSLADTGNQLLLAYGIKKSLQTPTEYHPYGYHNMRYVASLVSGVGIFFLGAGLSFYHGIMGILTPDTMESLYWAYIVLGGSLISEGGTLAVAFRETRRGAKRDGMTVAQYILRGQDPSVNVVLLEDIAAVFGIFIAGGCMGLTSYTGLPIYDAVGSLAVGGVLGAVASFIIYTNAAALVGRSITAERLLEINKEMENDIMIRAIHDVKATDMGNNYVRYKAEVDFDGRELTRSYLDSQDLENLLKEMQRLKTIEDVEAFMLKHGESIVDMLGGQIDRIEVTLKKKHPEVRHVDLEVL